MSVPTNQMKKYLFRETIVIELDLSATDENSVMETGTNFVHDLLRGGRIVAEMKSGTNFTYRLNSDGGDVQINN
jgi:hypothetical protein